MPITSRSIKVPGWSLVLVSRRTPEDEMSTMVASTSGLSLIPNWPARSAARRRAARRRSVGRRAFRARRSCAVGILSAADPVENSKGPGERAASTRSVMGPTPGCCLFRAAARSNRACSRYCATSVVTMAGSTWKRPASIRWRGKRRTRSDSSRGGSPCGASREYGVVMIWVCAASGSWRSSSISRARAAGGRNVDVRIKSGTCSAIDVSAASMSRTITTSAQTRSSRTRSSTAPRCGSGSMARMRVGGDTSIIADILPIRQQAAGLTPTRVIGRGSSKLPG